MGSGNINPIKYGIMAVVFMTITGVVSGMLPFVGILLYPAAIFFFICGARFGFIFTLPFVIASYVFVALATSFSGALSDILGPAVSAAMMGELMRLHRSQYEIVTKGIVIGIMCNLASLMVIKLAEGRSMLTELREVMRTSLNEGVNSGQLPIGTADAARETFEYMLQCIPAMMIIMSIIGTIFIFYVGCYSMIKRGTVIKGFTSFRGFSFSKTLLYGGIIMILLAYLVGMMGVVNSDALILNVVLVMWTMTCIQGLAAAAYVCRSINFPKVFFVLFASIIIVSMVGTIVLFIFGLADVVFNIRGRIESKQKGE